MVSADERLMYTRVLTAVPRIGVLARVLQSRDYYEMCPITVVTEERLTEAEQHCVSVQLSQLLVAVGNGYSVLMLSVVVGVDAAGGTFTPGSSAQLS